MTAMFRVALISVLTWPLALRESAGADRQMERLGRGVIAVRQEAGVFVSWRLLATDVGQVAFDVYRSTSNQQAWEWLGKTSPIISRPTPAFFSDTGCNRQRDRRSKLLVVAILPSGQVPIDGLALVT